MPPELNLDLTLEQQFQIQMMAKEFAAMNHADLQELLLKTSYLLMVKENVIKSLLKIDLDQ